jgi:hypothetical protein
MPSVDYQEFPRSNDGTKIHSHVVQQLWERGGRFPSRQKRQEVCAGRVVGLELSCLKVIGVRPAQRPESQRERTQTAFHNRGTPRKSGQNREWTAHVAMRAAEEPLEDGLYSKFHSLLPQQSVVRLWVPLSQAHIEPSGLKENCSARTHL